MISQNPESLPSLPECLPPSRLHRAGLDTAAEGSPGSDLGGGLEGSRWLLPSFVLSCSRHTPGVPPHWLTWAKKGEAERSQREPGRLMMGGTSEEAAPGDNVLPEDGPDQGTS